MALFYKKNGDNINALSKALDTAHQSQKSEAKLQNEYSSVEPCTHKSEGKNELSDDTIVQACVSLNLRINKQIKCLIDTYHEGPLLCVSFDPEKLVQELGTVHSSLDKAYKGETTVG